jgi:hypothetical protein
MIVGDVEQKKKEMLQRDVSLLFISLVKFQFPAKPLLD